MKVTVQQCEEALLDSCGIVSQAARNLKISRNALITRIANHKSLQEAVVQSREIMIDEGESALVTAVKDGQGWAVSLLLKTIGKHRGYIEKSELEVGGNLNIKVVKFGDNDTK
jgi:hypothetical protein